MRVLKKVISYLWNYFIFFCVISFVVTCSFLLFGSLVRLPEEDVRTYAPWLLINILILTALFAAGDIIRRIITVDRPAKAIQKVLEEMKKGNYDARIAVPYIINKENRFREISESINLLGEELASVETLRTDFIANVSHELKTPLAVMQNYGTMLQQPDLSDESRIEYAKAVSDASRRLANLITNILKLNKLENQQIFPEGALYDLGEQLCECLLQFENIWEKKNIEIETDIADGICIKADEELLSLVWNNLFSNAFKFTDDGGKVSLVLTADEKYATVKVTDTGCGMSSEVGAHIFEKFYQGDTSHATHGNGLGLALVKRVVDITRGEIRVESAKGEGSTFTVKIQRRHK
ncbi:MAG: HAMP domain-containing histidine kinase [Clostridia bacterium]|nr:HAMP domain-containing histidine kinase [Clostridia bacterium]